MTQDGEPHQRLPVLVGPAKGTGISCLTPTLWVLLSNYGIARRFTSVDGKIRKIHYDDSNWSMSANVQLD